MRVMETVVTEDGHEKALVSRDGNVAQPVGWINMVLAGKNKGEADSESLVTAQLLEVTFDLKVRVRAKHSPHLIAC